MGEPERLTGKTVAVTVLPVSRPGFSVSRPHRVRPVCGSAAQPVRMAALGRGRRRPTKKR